MDENILYTLELSTQIVVQSCILVVLAEDQNPTLMENK